MIFMTMITTILHLESIIYLDLFKYFHVYTILTYFEMLSLSLS